MAYIDYGFEEIAGKRSRTLNRRDDIHFRWPGGKSMARACLVPRLNDLIAGEDIEVRDPGFGGGSVPLTLFKLNRRVNKFWGNDLYVPLAAYWNAVLLAPGRLKQWVMDFVPTVDAFRQHRAELRAVKVLPDGVDDFVRLGALHLFVQQLSFSGLGVRGGPLGGWGQTGPEAIDSRFNPEAVCERIDRTHDLMARLEIRHGRITQYDFEPVIRDDTHKAVIFVDPPYVKQGHALYPCAFTPADHLRLRDALRETPHRWLLTYDDCEEVRDWYSWASVRQVEVPSFIPSDRGSRRRKSELVITPARMRVAVG